MKKFLYVIKGMSIFLSFISCVIDFSMTQKVFIGKILASHFSLSYSVFLHDPHLGLKNNSSLLQFFLYILNIYANNAKNFLAASKESSCKKNIKNSGRQQPNIMNHVLLC
ncbi:hypothetical protein ACJX0J_037377, partial [Zea mays]